MKKIEILQFSYIEGRNIQIGSVYKSPYIGKRILLVLVSSKNVTLVECVVDIPSVLASYKDLQIEKLQV